MMPSNRQSLQSQGVPIPNRLNGPRGQSGTATVRSNSTPARRSNAPSQSSSLGQRGPRKSRGTGLSEYNPASMGNKSTAGVGVLEAEFLVAIGLLIMLMFANSTATYSDRIMSLMKRGSLTCLMFFILSLVSAGGDNAAKIAKAFGALVIIAIALTSPMGTVFTDLDNLIKNDWVGSSETEGGTLPASANYGTSTGAISSASQYIANALQNSQQGLKQITGLNKQQLGVVGQVQDFLSGILGKL